MGSQRLGIPTLVDLVLHLHRWHVSYILSPSLSVYTLYISRFMEFIFYTYIDICSFYLIDVGGMMVDGEWINE